MDKHYPLSLHQDLSPQLLVNHGGLGTIYHSISDTEAKDIASSHFGVVGAFFRLTTEKDDTFRIDTADGQQFVLKIANPAEDPAEIAFQVDLMRHIRAVDDGIPVPCVIQAKNEYLFVMLTDRAGQRRCARMTSYMPGLLLDSTDCDARERYCVGQVLGKLRHATADFHHPKATRTLAWNILHLTKLRGLVDEVIDAERRDMLRRAMDRFDIVESRILKLRRQVLHNDFSKSNIVVDHAYEAFVRGVIDFGDAVHTAIAIDVSTALLNQLPRRVQEDDKLDIFSDARDVLHGYLSIADLTQEELSLLPYLVMGRVVARALITSWRAVRFPGNSTYILRNTEPGWAQLGWFLHRRDEELLSLFL